MGDDPQVSAAMGRAAMLLREVRDTLDAAALDVAGLPSRLRLRGGRDDLDEALTLVEASLQTQTEGTGDDADRDV